MKATNTKYKKDNPGFMFYKDDTEDKVIGDKEAQEFIVKELNKK